MSFADVAALGKVELINFGSHAIRTAVGAMQDGFRRILAEGGMTEWKRISPPCQRCSPCRACTPAADRESLSRMKPAMRALT